MFTKEDFIDLVETRVRQMYLYRDKLNSYQDGAGGYLKGYLFFVDDDRWFRYPYPYQLLYRACEVFFVNFQRDDTALETFLTTFREILDDSSLTGFHQFPHYIIDQIIDHYLKAIFVAPDDNVNLKQYKVNILKGYVFMAEMTECIDHTQASHIYNFFQQLNLEDYCNSDFNTCFINYMSVKPIFQKILEDDYGEHD